MRATFDRESPTFYREIEHTQDIERRLHSISPTFYEPRFYEHYIL